MLSWNHILIALGLMTAPAPPPHPAPAPSGYLVRDITIGDEKPVYATVDTINVVPARARVSGTVASVFVRQGDHVDAGQPIAVAGDPKLGMALVAASAQAGVARSQLAQAAADFDRAQRLKKADAISQTAFDAARTAYEVAQHNVAAQSANRASAGQQIKEGEILAPAAGRVLTLTATPGTVVLPGDSIATVAVQDFVLRMQVPERHARALKIGDPVRVEGADIGLPPGAKFGTITLIYPQIAAGRVQVDARLPGLTDYFVGERVLVWVNAGKRRGIVIPAHLIHTRAGIDYVRLREPNGVLDVPVQRGEPQHSAGLSDGVEILSGLRDGDRLGTAGH